MDRRDDRLDALYEEIENNLTLVGQYYADIVSTEPSVYIHVLVINFI